MKRAIFALAIAMALAGGVRADHDGDGKHDSDRFEFKPGTLVLSRSVYSAPAGLITAGKTLLPPGCTALSATCFYAVSDAEYPNLNNTNNVWNNNTVDGSFGVTSPIFLDNITLDGHLIDTLPIPTDRLVTSFSSKSELALNRSLDGKSITFMGYVAPVDTLDASNSNTVGVVDPTNPVMEDYNRGVAEVDADGRISVTQTYAYSGNNGRAAIKADWTYYTVGNSNNGTGTPANVTTSTGVEYIVPGQAPPAAPNQIGTFSIAQYYPTVTDKAGKDNNFRGLTIHDHTLYVTKGSGSNGIDTVYQVGCAGELPTPSNAPGTCAPAGTLAELSMVPMTVLPGFPIARAKTAGAANIYPFGIWFANDTTLYVADEGDGTLSDITPIVKTPNAGLQKWSLVSGNWQLDYVLQAGLNIGVPYTVANYPASIDPATGGLRNITGRVNHDGTVTIWAVTSTVSTNGDQGADPNKLVMITDVLANTTAPTPKAGDGDHDRDDSWEQFVTLRTAKAGEVLRGVAFAPQDRDEDDHDHDH